MRSRRAPAPRAAAVAAARRQLADEAHGHHAQPPGGAAAGEAGAGPADELGAAGAGVQGEVGQPRAQAHLHAFAHGGGAVGPGQDHPRLRVDQEQLGEGAAEVHQEGRPGRPALPGGARRTARRGQAARGTPRGKAGPLRAGGVVDSVAEPGVAMPSPVST